MFKKIVDMLIDSGVMRYYTENYYTKKIVLETFQSSPEVLLVNDLSFGFNIWLGFCCLSVVIFVVEIMMKIVESRFKSKNKIDPQTTSNGDDQNSLQEMESKPEVNDDDADQVEQKEIEQEMNLDEIIEELLAIDMDDISYDSQRIASSLE